MPLIMEAKTLGYQVIGIDSNSSAPGFIKCDLKIQESIENYKEIYTKLQELLIDGKICGVLTRSYGNAIKTVSFLCEKFSIPHVPFYKCDEFINKKRMKDIFVHNDIESPQSKNLPIKNRPNKATADIFPLIAKPIIGHAKTDVRLVKNISELTKLLSTIKRSNRNYLFEKFIPGNEIIAVGLIFQKKYHLIDITDKETTFPPYFVDKIHISPSRYYHLFEKIESIGQRVTEAFEINTSPMIMEFVADSKDNLFLIEAVPEFGGEFLSDIVIPARTGYNVFAESIKAITNRGFSQPVQQKNRDAVVCRYVIGDKGVLSSFNPHGPQKIRGVLFSRVFKEIGAEIKKPVTNHDRVGVVIVKGGTTEEAYSLAEEAEKSFNIRIKQK